MFDPMGWMAWRVAGIVKPALYISRNFHDVAALALFEADEEIGFFGVPDIGRDPFEVDAIGFGAVEQFQSDMVLWPIDDIVGNAGLTATFAVVVPAFGEEEFGIEHGSEACVEGAESELHGDDAVGGFPETAAILPLDAGCLLAGLGMAGIVDDADGFGIFMIAGYDLLHALTGAGMVPDIGVEELLQSARRDVIELRDRFDAFALKIAELATNVPAKMFARLGSSEAIVELIQKIGQGRFEGEDLFAGHP